MKNLFLIRHAKSDWSNSDLDDFDRPLNKRGLRDAPFMAKLLKSKIDKVDAIYSSPANRALSTANFFAESFGIDTENIIQDSNLYLSSYEILIKCIKDFEDSYQDVIMVTHNPGITDLSNYLSNVYIDNIPTTGIVALKFSEDSWKKIGKKKCKLVFFEYPKKYIKT
jgi:phosphohistidine phosphatase